jgi:hypothetical protein
MRTEIVDVTPDVAREMLEKSKIRNRAISRSFVKRLADDMKAGLWKQNGETIIVSKDEDILDGQHRLHAVILSETRQQLLVTFDVETSVFPTIDIGRSRSGGDILWTGGTTDNPLNAKRASTALNVVWTIERGEEDGLDIYKCRSFRGIPKSRVLEYAREHAEILRSLEVVPSGQDGGMLFSSPVLVGLHYLFAKKDKDQADKFVTDLIKGTDLDEEDPVFRLREILIKDAKSISKKPMTLLAGHVVKAWNRRRSGVDSSRLTITPNKESFPKII